MLIFCCKSNIGTWWSSRYHLTAPSPGQMLSSLDLILFEPYENGKVRLNRILQFLTDQYQSHSVLVQVAIKPFPVLDMNSHWSRLHISSFNISLHLACLVYMHINAFFFTKTSQILQINPPSWWTTQVFLLIYIQHYTLIFDPPSSLSSHIIFCPRSFSELKAKLLVDLKYQIKKSDQQNNKFVKRVMKDLN